MIKLLVVKEFLKKYWKPLLLMVTIVGVLWHYHSIINERDRLRVEIELLEERIKSFHLNEIRFLSTIQEQNMSIMEFKRVREQLEQQNKTLVEQRHQIQRELDRAIREIVEIEIDSSCEGSMDFLLEQALDK